MVFSSVKTYAPQHKARQPNFNQYSVNFPVIATLYCQYRVKKKYNLKETI